MYVLPEELDFEKVNGTLRKVVYVFETEKDKKRNERTLAKYIGDGKHHIIGKWTATYEK